MHPIRRRKKRPNYGVRTVEVSRGKNGFGFTISGQQPCILSCIVAGSPAEKAGLRPGDYLVAVNGQSVSKVPHDDVVRLIGCSSGILKLQIAENYYSDSSDEDAIIPARPKPKYMHKPRNGGHNQRTTASSQQSRGAKIVRDLRTGAMYEQQVEPSAMLQSPGKSDPPLSQQWEPPVPLPLPRPRFYPHPQTEESCEQDRDKVEFRALVGYLGTIEMPKKIQPGSRLQVVRSCIKRLRTEKRAHTLVLMSIHTHSLTLTNCHEVTLAEYPSDRVTFCGTSSDEERRFFGIITTAVRSVEDENDGRELVHSSSCHVFAIELRLHGSHGEHAGKADAFGLHCTVDAATGFCTEFPSSSEPIISAVKVLCSSQETGTAGNPYVEEPLVANSPQPSNASSITTTASSNSDSGIGFRDDCGNQSDRILVVDVQNQRLHIQQMVNSNCQVEQGNISGVNQPKSCMYGLTGSANSRLVKHPDDRLTVRVMPDPVMNLSGTLAVSSRSRSPLSSSSSEGEKHEQKSNPCIEIYSEQVEMPVYNFSSYCGETALSKNMATRSNDDMSVSSGTSKSQGQLNLQYKHNMYKNFMTNKTVSQCFHTNIQEKSVNDANYNFPRFPGIVTSVGSVGAMSIGSVQSHDAVLSCKLSPKVFGTPLRPMTHSLEDLKVTEVPNDEKDPLTASLSLSSRGQHWGSLQDLRSFVVNCFEASPPPKDMNRPQLKKWGVATFTATKTFVRATTGPRAGKRISRDLQRSSSDEGVFSKHEGHDPGVELLQEDEREQGVASWATSFEKLLGDSAGLHTFAEFLKKEFSHENIYFWVACEKYRSLSSSTERTISARDIFERHLCLGALEPVNVDSHARQATQDGLTDAASTLFLQAQKQIFNLMKFDSYPRFLKSDLYKECLVRELSGQELPFPGGDNLDTGLQLHGTGSYPSHSKLKKSRSDAEDHHRKSLLPWHRKNRSKSKDRGESEYNKLRMLQQKHDTEDTVSVRSDVTSSRSSLASWDLALRGSFSRQSVTSGEGESCCTLCRVILPDSATTVVQTRSSESVRDLVLRLLDKRGLHYSAFEVFYGTSVKPLSLDEDSTILAGKEVHVEQRAVFRLDLPNRKTVGVKAKIEKSLGEILRPILHKYGYKLELVTLCLMSENEVVEIGAPVISVDNQRLQVLTRSAEAWKNEVAHTVASQHRLKVAGPTLDEITNRVFEELLQGKATETTHTASDQGSIRSEDWCSEHSSGIFGRFLRRDSALLDKVRESRVKGKKAFGTSKHVGDESEAKVVPTSHPKPPLITKWKVGVKLQGRSESDELYEGLKRAQRSRLEDQRGTEINFELPDFLKDKENAPQTGKKFRKLRRGEENTSKVCEPSELHPESQHASNSQERLPAGTSGTRCGYHTDRTTPRALATRLLDQSFVAEGVIPSPHQAEEYFLGHQPDPNKLNKTHHGDISGAGSSLENTLVELNPLEATLACLDSRDEVNQGLNRLHQHIEPPPLPPKPKHLPLKTSMWESSSNVSGSANPSTFRAPGDSANSRFLKPTEVKRDVRVCRSRRTVYLDQPSSSFV